MQDYNTIIGVIQMRQNECTFNVIEARYHIGSSTVQLILERFDTVGLTLDELKIMEPQAVEELIYPRKTSRGRRSLCLISSTIMTVSMQKTVR